MAIIVPSTTELQSGKPGKTSIFTKFRTAILSLESSALLMGGPGIDGDITSLSTLGATRPVFANTINISAAETASASMMLVYSAGDMTISDALTIPTVDQSGLDSSLLTKPDKYIGIANDVIGNGLECFKNYHDIPVIVGGAGTDTAGTGSGGGGYGNGDESGGSDLLGGDGYSGISAYDLGLRRAFYIGGQGSDETTGLGAGGNGGGCIIIVVDGDLTLSGSILAKGANGTGSGSNEGGGGGGGCVLIYCTGAIDGTGGTIDVSGGDGWTNGGGRAGGGGGGYIGIYCPSVSTSPTYTVLGGLDNTSRADSGLAEENQLGGSSYAYTEDEIRHIIRGMGLAA